MQTKKIELLAPAKNFETAVAAIKCGADAIYIGAPSFSARQAASNSIEEIESVIKYANQYYVKIYAALNTILTDQELYEAQIIIENLAKIGIDGLIIQDMGLLEVDLPDIPIIASTQMNNSTPKKVKFLEEIGISRAILARELSLEQIKEIKSAAKEIELECFVHGALCVSMSGQCYMSYAAGGRSGNRGECAQPCRKLYTLKDKQGNIIAKNKYLLSLKDLNLSEYLNNLLDAGITSFKIEGRLKTPAYVANIVGYYRQKLDILLAQRQLEASSSGKVELGFSPDPARTFSRGFTDYGIDGSQGNMASIHTPKATGEYIGKVSAIGADTFEIDSTIPLTSGDGICFLDSRNILQGTTINKVCGNIIQPQSMEYIIIGCNIYRNFDHKFNKQLAKLPSERAIPIIMRVFDDIGGIAVDAIDQDGNHVTVELLGEFEPAKNKDKGIETITRQLSKLGNTVFSCDEVKIDLNEVYFFPVSLLNNLRREITEALLEKRLLAKPKKHCQFIKDSKAKYPEAKLSYMGNVLNKNSENFYRRHGVDEFEPAAETGINMNGKKVMTTKYCLRYELGICPKQGKTNNADDLILESRERDTYNVKFECSKCGMEIFYESVESLT